MKKVIGICLILLGSAMFLLCGYGFLEFMTSNKESFIARYAKNGQDATTFYKEGIDNHIQHGRVKTGLLTLLGAGIILSSIGFCRKPAGESK